MRGINQGAQDLGSSSPKPHTHNTLGCPKDAQQMKIHILHEIWLLIIALGGKEVHKFEAPGILKSTS